MARPRINVHVSDRAGRLLDAAAIHRSASKASIVEAAIIELLAPEIKDRVRDAQARRLDRLTRATERIADETVAQTETLALFILYYLCITPPLPDDARAAAEALGRKRFDHFIAQVGDRLLGKERYADALLAAMGLERADEDVAPADPDAGRRERGAVL